MASEGNDEPMSSTFCCKIESKFFERTLSVLTFLVGGVTFVSGIILWKDSNKRPFLERQIAVYETALLKASTGAFHPSQAAAEEFASHAYGPLKMVADDKINAVSELVKFTLMQKGAIESQKISEAKGRSITETRDVDPSLYQNCAAEYNSAILADCMRESISASWGYQFRGHSGNNLCTPQHFEEQTKACHVPDAGALKDLFSGKLRK